MERCGAPGLAAQSTTGRNWISASLSVASMASPGAAAATLPSAARTRPAKMNARMDRLSATDAPAYAIHPVPSCAVNADAALAYRLHGFPCFEPREDEFGTDTMG